MPSTKKSKSSAPAPVQSVSFVSLGCPKNLVDSEKMLGLLAEDGLIPVPAGEPSDAVVINTCGFLEASKEESIGEIREAAAAKQRGEVRRIVVAGCLVQRHRAKLLEWCPDIDALIGVFDRDRIVEAVRGPQVRGGGDVSIELPVFSSIAANATLAREHRKITATGYHEDDSGRLRLTPRHYAYLRISEGCNQNCAFCTIPSIRGKMRSKPLDRILSEASELIADGAFELNLIGQDTTSYGQDIGDAGGLVGMLTALNGMVAKESLGWIRLMYAYPSCFTDEMIDAIARLSHVVKYIDMPLQHISDRVLDAMRRRTSRKLIETLLAKLRDRIPSMAIRTTFISGFPGETEQDHRELVDFVRSAGFEAMGVFPYSPEPNTPAGTMHAQGKAVDEDVIQARLEELMLTQQEVAFAHGEKLARESVELDVLIDEQGAEEEVVVSLSKSARKGHLHTGRTRAQAPQIDGVTYVVAREALLPGEVIRCQVTDALGYDLVARPMSELQQKRSLPVVGQG